MAKMLAVVASTLAAASVALAGCGGVDATGCSKVVKPGAGADANHAAIQDALSGAAPGDTICLAPGTYALHDELSLSVDNVTVRSTHDGMAVLDFAGQNHGANGLSVVSVKGFKVQSLTVKNTPGDAIRVTQSDNVVFDHVVVTWGGGAATTNGAYGLYPVQCNHVLIDACTVSYAADAGIYVGQSKQILVKNSEAFGNVAGIEIENSTDAEVVNNYAHDNTAGVLVFALPTLMMKSGARAKVHGNRMLNNNGDNFAAKSSIVSLVPTGSGFLLIASDNNEVYDNDITGNVSIGVAVVSYFIAMRDDYKMDPMYDPFPEGNSIHDNRFGNNGMNPAGLAENIALIANVKVIDDMVWDGITDKTKMNADGALTNCFKNNGAATFRNLGIDDNGMLHPSTDRTPVDCMHPALPSVTP